MQRRETTFWGLGLGVPLEGVIVGLYKDTGKGDSRDYIKSI